MAAGILARGASFQQVARAMGCSRTTLSRLTRMVPTFFSLRCSNGLRWVPIANLPQPSQFYGWWSEE
ncbi:hypothetical protein M5E06_04065 [Azospirillum sp. A1-3]|uniref:helix-turn-helix domain-containing protein n=1 Tax=Azospirillum sp. A1-3 TaxID=185874 RepID=UPI0020773675|nr:hypothetical protein [Azospirillum sp. A1-3]MCM8733369.1 hypothetical protein [Azospirillum sp. A1-3]